MPMLKPETTRHLITRCEDALDQTDKLSEDDVRALRTCLGALHRGRVLGRHLSDAKRALRRCSLAPAQATL